MINVKNNRMWIVLAAVFIVANVATFIFAYGRVKTVEKVVTIYKEAETKPSDSHSDTKKQAAKAALPKQETLKAAIRDFNDSDYLTDNEKFEEKALAPDNEGGKAKEAVKTDEPGKAAQGGHSAAGSAAEDSYEFSNPYDNSPSPSEEVRLADEGVPIPQLPLFDTDFEGHVDRGGYEEIPLPPLPDVM